MTRSHWFADVDADAPEPQYLAALPRNRSRGHIPCFEVWFATKEDCEAWIRDYVIGAPLGTR